MINRNISQIIKNGYKKNYREYFALKNKLYPQFVFDSTLKTLRDEIPVFTLHSVNPKKFEEQLVFLSENNYNTINADNLYEYLIGTRKIEERTIVLTFDDGWKNLYTVVYPLLKKYAFKAVCFLIANLIPEKESETFEIDTEKVNNNFYPDSNILCNWDEIAEMENSGVIDFQSHSMNHYLISISPVIKDFIFPNYDGYALNLDIPLLQFDDKENYSRSLALGTPIYENDSRFSGKKRFFDDEKLRDECTDFVKNNGEREFFKNPNWRAKLNKIVQNYKKNNTEAGFYENEMVMKECIFNELSESKKTIENKLVGKKANHFCYPWWVGSKIALELSKEAGYITNFWGVIPEKRTNKIGDDPFKISRILSDDFIYSLPGKGRKTLGKIILDKFSSEIKNKLK